MTTRSIDFFVDVCISCILTALVSYSIDQVGAQNSLLKKPTIFASATALLCVEAKCSK